MRAALVHAEHGLLGVGACRHAHHVGDVEGRQHHGAARAPGACRGGIGIIDREESLRPSTSQERERTLANLNFSWNALDFGVSYYRAQQKADQVLMAEERRRKVVQNVLQDVRNKDVGPAGDSLREIVFRT